MPLKIVHSFWSKPAFDDHQDYYNSRQTAGWLNLRYFLLSSCLSCLTAIRHHKRIELHTDQKGYDYLIDLLQLPYNDVYLSLNDLNHLDHRLWVQAKFKAFKLQKEPFIHIDNDVYLWKELFSDCPNSLVAQSNMQIIDFYKSTLKEILSTFEFIPKCMKDVKVSLNTREANTGVLGGTNIDFIQEYCELADEFHVKNSKSLLNIDIGHFNMVMEQFLFTCLAKHKRLKVSYVISSYQRYAWNDILRFNLVPIVEKYIHLVGGAKRNKYACQQLELRLCHEFPKEYSRITSAMNDRFPETNKQDLLEPAARKILLNNISYFYNNDVSDFKMKKIKLADHTTIFEKKEKGEREIYLSTTLGKNGPETKKLSGQDVILSYFNHPTSINEILSAIRDQGLCTNQDELQLHSNRIVDFVSRKIVLDGLLAFD